MSFWDLSDGSALEKTTEYESKGGGSLFPDDTKVLAAIEEVKWQEYDGDRTISIKWRVISDNFKNRVQFQSLKMFGTKHCKDKNASSDKAKRMLGAIDTNAGGNLPRDREPTDQDLMGALMGKAMGVHIKIYTPDDKSKEPKNYVAGISSKPVPSNATAKSAPARVVSAPQSQASSNNFDDIPF